MRILLVVPAFLLLAGAALAEPPFQSPGHAGKALEAEDAVTRVQAAQWLGTVRAPEERSHVLLLLGRALRDVRPEVRRAAAISLGSLGDPAAAPTLQVCLAREGDDTVSAALLLALGAVGDEGSRRALVGYLDHETPGVRAAAILALGDLGGDDARAAALEILSDTRRPDPTWVVRSAAVLALAKCGRRGDMDPILAAYRSGGGYRSWFARSALVRAAATLDPDPVAFLLHYVFDEDSRVAVTAAEGLSRSGHPEEVVKLLIHTAPQIRAVAAAAVEKAHVTSAYDRIRRMARLDRSLVVRWSCALALFRLEDPDGDDLVLEAVSSSEPAVWAEAVAVLAARTGAEHGRNVSAWREELRRLRVR